MGLWYSSLCSCPGGHSCCHETSFSHRFFSLLPLQTKGCHPCSLGSLPCSPTPAPALTLQLCPLPNFLHSSWNVPAISGWHPNLSPCITSNGASTQSEVVPGIGHYGGLLRIRPCYIWWAILRLSTWTLIFLIYMHVCMRAWVHVYVHACVHTCVHIYIWKKMVSGIILGRFLPSV